MSRQSNAKLDRVVKSSFKKAKIKNKTVTSRPATSILECTKLEPVVKKKKIK